MKLAQIPLQLQSAALVLAIPVLKRTRSAIDTAETFRAATRLLLPLTLPALVVIAVAGRDITAAMFGSQFDLGGAVYIWLAAGGLVSVATGPTGPYLVARSLDRALIIRSAVAILINIGTNIALIPRWGALGAAISTAVSLALLSLSGLYVVGRSAGAHPLGLRHLFRVVASVGTIAAAVVVARELTHGAWARTIVCSVVAVAASVASDWRSYRDLAMRRKPVPQ